MCTPLLRWICCLGPRRREPIEISKPLDNPRLRPVSIQPPRAVPQTPNVTRLPILTRLDSIEAAVQNAAMEMHDLAPPQRPCPDVPRTPSASTGPSIRPSQPRHNSAPSEYSDDSSSHHSSWYAA